MKTRVEFKSSAFPKYANEDDEIVNENCWGKRLAEYVRDHLPKYGVRTVNILCEDWGWLVYVENEAYPLWIGCGVMEDSTEEKSISNDLTQFTVFVAAEPKILQRLFKKVDTKPGIEKVTNALRTMIAECPEFVDAEWSEA